MVDSRKGSPGRLTHRGRNKYPENVLVKPVATLVYIYGSQFY